MVKFRKLYKKEDIAGENIKDWKEKNKRYLHQLQKFLDATDSIEKDDTKKNVIAQMLRCDQILTDLALKEINKVREERN